jgi:chromosome segregation ATPase
MEVDFPDSETTRPMQPPILEPQALWEEIARLYVKLGKFGHGYAQGHEVLQSWQGKLNGMANMIVDLHAKMGELVHRFLSIESQDPIMHISNLHGEVAGMKAQLQQCAEALQGIRGEIAKIQAWQGQAESLATLPGQVAQAQKEVRGTWDELVKLREDCARHFQALSARETALEEKFAQEIRAVGVATNAVKQEIEKKGVQQSGGSQIAEALIPRLGALEQRLITAERNITNAATQPAGISAVRFAQFEADIQRRFQQVEAQLRQVSSQSLPAVIAPLPDSRGELAWPSSF